MTMTTETFDYIRELVHDKSAIIIDDSKQYLVDTRMEPLVRDSEFSGADELVASLRSGRDRSLRDAIVNAMTTNETSFFRDHDVFDVLRDHVLPDLIEKRRHVRKLSFWCAAASSGQEPYSTLMLIRENFPELIDWEIEFVATDISTEMIDRCRKGEYNQLEMSRGLPAPLLVKYFERAGTAWQIHPDLREQVDFQIANLVEPLPTYVPREPDIVFIRNVLIYFEVEIKRRILEEVHTRLAPDGYMFLGGAETTLNLHQGFDRVQFERGGCFVPKKD